MTIRLGISQDANAAAGSQALGELLPVLEERLQASERAAVATGELHRALVWQLMKTAVRATACRFDLPVGGGRLEQPPPDAARWVGRLPDAPACEVEHAQPEELVPAIGAFYEHLLDHRLERDATGHLRWQRARTGKRSGRYYTPRAIVRIVVERALAETRPHDRARDSLRICDPAIGAGAFLVEACRQLTAGESGGPDAQRVARARVAQECLFGVDVDPLSVAVTESLLWLFAANPSVGPEEIACHVRVGDALLGFVSGQCTAWEAPSPEAFDWLREFPSVLSCRAGFDVIIGNPPWVAYAGRATQPIPRARRAFFRERFSAWHGYPTLHALFVERSAQLAPSGVIALLLPSPLADLDGYRAARAVLTRQHEVCSPLLEFGQDAFAGVTQPCFALVARPSATARSSPSPWPLQERQRKGGQARVVAAPPLLSRLREGPCLPGSMFREMGFQSTSRVTRDLFLRADGPDAVFRYPLLEGRNVHPFQEDAPRLFLNDDPLQLRAAGARLRPATEYQQVDFVVRQTSAYPIAARHHGLPFRNSLLAGFAQDDLSVWLMVGLLNSALYRALHLATQRDARQAAFPQVKVGHLRALPRPPDRPESRERVARWARRATDRGLDDESRARLDVATFDLFEAGEVERQEVLAFLAGCIPALGYGPG